MSNLLLNLTLKGEAEVTFDSPSISTSVSFLLLIPIEIPICFFLSLSPATDVIHTLISWHQFWNSLWIGLLLHFVQLAEPTLLKDPNHHFQHVFTLFPSFNPYGQWHQVKIPLLTPRSSIISYHSLYPTTWPTFPVELSCLWAIVTPDLFCSILLAEMPFALHIGLTSSYTIFKLSPDVFIPMKLLCLY